MPYLLIAQYLETKPSGCEFLENKAPQTHNDLNAETKTFQYIGGNVENWKFTLTVGKVCFFFFLKTKKAG